MADILEATTKYRIKQIEFAEAEYYEQLTKEIDKEIARAVVDNDEKLNEIFEEIDTKPEVGSFTQDEPQQEDQEVEEEQI